MRDEILIETAIPGGGRGAVVRSQGRLWLAEGEPPRPATSLGNRGVDRVGLRDGLMLAGGQAPPGAARAQVTAVRGEHVDAAVGNEAWVVVLDQPTRAETDVAVCFFDASGRLFAPPPPRRAEPIVDAAEPCPACTATQWLLVSPRREESFALCAVCGHEETLGTWFGPECAEPVADAPTDWVDEFHVREVAPMLAAIDFAVYGPAGRRPVTIGGWGGGDRRADRITLTSCDEQLEVETCADHDQGFLDDDEHARDALALALDRGLGAWPPELSAPATSLWLKARGRRCARAAAWAVVTRCELMVDGRRRAFVTAQSDDCWAAVGRVNGLTLVVTARGLERELVSLRRLTELAALRMVS